MDVRKFGPEWFAVALGTLAVSINSLRLSRLYPLAFMASAFFYLGLLVLIAVTALWLTRLVRYPSVISADYWNLARLSFVPVLPLSVIVALTVDIASGNSLLPLPDYVYFLVYYVSYVAVFVMAVALGVRLMFHEVEPNSLTYAVLIPPVTVTATSFLGVYLREYLLSALSVGVGLMLLVFLGSVSVTFHVRESKTPARLTSPVLLTGVSSVIALTILGVSGGGMLPESTAYFVALVLVGFETWNFFVSISLVALGFSRVRREPLLLWALTFPVSTYSSASFELFLEYRDAVLLTISVLAYSTLLLMWALASALTLKGLIVKQPH